jgi:hypothetical protein
MDTVLKVGMTVVCTDDQNVQQYVKKNEKYRVEGVIHRGTLLKVEGVAITLASCRFKGLASTPPETMEFANAGNS